MEKKCADFRLENKWHGRGLNPWPAFPIALLWPEKALALTAEPSDLWGERYICPISTFIFTFSSFLKKVNI